MLNEIVNIGGVSKSFGSQRILDDVSFCISPAEIVGLIGPNGGGKSTLISILAGNVLPTVGQGQVCGIPLFSGKSPFCGLMLEHPPFIDSISGYRNLYELAQLRHIIDSSCIIESMKRVGLDPHNKKPVQHYSQGMRQRLALAQAFMEHPPLLLLDEPLNGLDPTGILDIRYLLQDLAREGITIFFSSHVISEVREVCNRIFLLAQGKIIELSAEDCSTREHIEAFYKKVTGYTYG